MFVLAAVHGIFCIIQFHSLGDVNALVSIFTSNKAYSEISEFPFQTLGFTALIILFLMAATSHDFWLKNLGPGFWKAMHMCVYLAYGLIILHVALGTLQYENNPFYWVLLTGGFVVICGLHLYTGFKERAKTRQSKTKLSEEGYYLIGDIRDIPPGSSQGGYVGWRKYSRL